MSIYESKLYWIHVPTYPYIPAENFYLILFSSFNIGLENNFVIVLALISIWIWDYDFDDIPISAVWYTK